MFFWTGTDENLLTEILKVSQKISFLLKDKLNAEGINLFNSNNEIAQQDVPHYHIHVIPRYSGDDFKFEFKNKTKDKNLNKIAEKIKG